MIIDLPRPFPKKKLNQLHLSETIASFTFSLICRLGGCHFVSWQTFLVSTPNRLLLDAGPWGPWCWTVMDFDLDRDEPWCLTVTTLILDREDASTVARKNLHLRLFGRLNFQITSLLFNAGQALAMLIVTSFSVEFISCSRHVKDSTYFIDSSETFFYVGWSLRIQI